MSKQLELPEQLVFGLDIGTRSVVGTVGYLENDIFHAVAQCVREHTSRAMIDGQIHDIIKVGEKILEVKQKLEQQIDRELKEVCIAAAGRVLRTVTTTVEQEYEEETVVDSEKIYSLDLLGMEKAQDELQKKNETDFHFYCVGYSVVRYYLNGNFIGNLEGHKASKVGEELIATFLPDEVVDGLYAAVHHAGLEVANLTLEPIAAINVAIPEKFRMLNIGLVDVGAGTSDICLTKDGSITAYGMIPMAGDELTDVIAKQYLVDFDMAESIKTSVRTLMEKEPKKKKSDGAAAAAKTITYEDIIGISHELNPQEVCDLLDGMLEEMTKSVADKIIELNGGKTVSAVFVVGGGGKFPGFTEKLATHLGLIPERVALRGEEVLGQVQFSQKNIKKDSLLVTPIGICLNFYDKKNNFIFANFNGERIKLYNNNHLTVVEAAMQANFPNDALFPRRGKELNFTVNGKSRIVRGTLGEAAVVTVNGQPADISTPINSNDKIEIKPSTKGAPAVVNVEDLPEFSDSIKVIVNKAPVICPKFVQANGELVSGFHSISEGDDIVVLHYYTLKQLLEFMDVILPLGTQVFINNKEAEPENKIYDNFTVDWSLEHNIYDIDPEAIMNEQEKAQKAQEAQARKEQARKAAENSEPAAQTGDEDLPGEEETADTAALGNGETGAGDDGGTNEGAYDSGVALSYDDLPEDDEEVPRAERPAPSVEAEEEPKNAEILAQFTVFVNQEPVLLKGKKDYIFVDVFEFIDFDLKTPHKGTVVTRLNGHNATYTEKLKPNDQLDIYWED